MVDLCNMETSRADAHKSGVSMQHASNTPTTSTPCVSLHRPCAPRTWSSQISFTPAPGNHRPCSSGRSDPGCWGRPQKSIVGFSVLMACTPAESERNSSLTTLWLCCSWNKLLIHLAGGELAPRLSLVSPKVFSPFCHRWSFRSLPLSPVACLVGDTSFPAQSSTWLHRYYLNWTKLDNAITKFNNEMHSADNWVLNPVILHYWHNLPIFILCSALLQFVLLKALYK